MAQHNPFSFPSDLWIILDGVHRVHAVIIRVTREALSSRTAGTEVIILSSPRICTLLPFLSQLYKTGSLKVCRSLLPRDTWAAGFWQCLCNQAGRGPPAAASICLDCSLVALSLPSSLGVHPDGSTQRSLLNCVFATSAVDLQSRDQTSLQVEAGMLEPTTFCLRHQIYVQAVCGMNFESMLPSICHRG